MGSQMFDQKMKICRRKASDENYKLIQLNWNLFIRRIITSDETWLHDYDPETKQTIQWKHARFPNPLKFKMQASAAKIMCTVFWDAEDMLRSFTTCRTRWQFQGPTMLTYFANCLSQVKRSAKESWPRYASFCMTTQMCIVTFWTGCCTWMGFKRNVPPTTFSWPGTQWISSVSIFKETHPKTEIFNWWWAQVCY